MRLHSLEITGFRRISQAKVHFGDATFLIGANNSGKSSILRAIEYLLSAKKKIPAEEYYSEIDSDTLEQKPIVQEIRIEAEFRNLPEESAEWRGFRGRIFDYERSDEGDSGKSIHYRKTYPIVGDCRVEILSRKRNLRAEFQDVKNVAELIENGINGDIVQEVFGGPDIKITKAIEKKLQEIDEIWELQDETEWFENPGGIPGVVLKRLPKFLLIPEESSAHEIDKNTGVLNKTLNELFNDVRDASENYKQAQTYLNALAKELDPADEKSDFGQLMGELNKILVSVFPDSAIHATADLTDPNSALKPNFEVKLASNIQTSVSLQDTGMVRSAVFALLRFRQNWLAKREGEELRGLIIGFEEPEIYLHPGAANQ
ncbi:MAG: AAA family ATPase, partial [Pseudomonadales bacterium]